MYQIILLLIPFMGASMYDQLSLYLRYNVIKASYTSPIKPASLPYVLPRNSIMTKLLWAFPPILPDKPHTLILGTMPGKKSLEAQQYYAHPQNQFWRFMGDIFGAYPTLPYDERVEVLKSQGIAVWDVVYACNREGSMDADIENEIVNDFEGFYRQHPSIELVVLDSLTAETIYKKRVIPTLTKELTHVRVPSPSPAHARMNYQAKLTIWRNVLTSRNIK